MGGKSLKIIHVTEALGGGVLNIVEQLSVSQMRDGNSVVIVHSVRLETPNEINLKEIFPSPIRRVVLPMVTNISPVKDFRALADLICIIKSESPDVVHLHSSKAGVLGRVACFFIGMRGVCFYTPHGYSFLRKDVWRIKRFLFFIIEFVVARLAGRIVACSQSEFDHAVRTSGLRKTVLVENSIPVDLVTPSEGSGDSSCLISTSGRLCFPKNPSAFRKLALALKQHSARFIWIGGGELENELLVNGVLPANIELTGWVSREQVAEFLRRSDLFVMTSLWEGMPLSLIEAQVAGLPAVVPDVEGCRDVVIDGVTGFVCQTAEDMVTKIELLIENPELRKRMGLLARNYSLQRFAPERMNAEMMLAYKGSDEYAVKGA